MPKKAPATKQISQAELISKAERILNRTLAYQAAIAVHEIKEVLELDVEELRLTVAPLSLDSPGAYRVTCTIASLAAPEPVVVDVVVEPHKAVIPNEK
jgi:hypothetical protein